MEAAFAFRSSSISNLARQLTTRHACAAARLRLAFAVVFLLVGSSRFERGAGRFRSAKRPRQRAGESANLCDHVRSRCGGLRCQRRTPPPTVPRSFRCGKIYCNCTVRPRKLCVNFTANTHWPDRAKLWRDTSHSRWSPARRRIFNIKLRRTSFRQKCCKLQGFREILANFYQEARLDRTWAQFQAGLRDKLPRDSVIRCVTSSPPPTVTFARS